MSKNISKGERIKAPERDSGRQQNVLLNKIYSEVKAIGERHSSLSDKVNKMDKVLQELDSKSFTIEMVTQIIKSNTGTIDAKVDRVEKGVDAIKVATMETSRDMKEIKGKLEPVTAGHEGHAHKLETV